MFPSSTSLIHCRAMTFFLCLKACIVLYSLILPSVILNKFEGKKYLFDNAFIFPNKSNEPTALAFLSSKNSSFLKLT